jgi:hypothetical protein
VGRGVVRYVTFLSAGSTLEIVGGSIGTEIVSHNHQLRKVIILIVS